MSQIPTFSVVIPLYNHEQYIEHAIASVLNQSKPPIDIVLIDDGSTDQGSEVANKILRDIPFAKVICQENRGAHAAINRAIECSTGSHVAVLNSDDTFKLQKLERCFQLFSADPELSLLFGRVEIIDSGGRSVSQSETTDWLERSYAFFRNTKNLPLALANENFALTTSNFVFSRELWKRAGGFKNLRYCHDLDFIMAACHYGNIHFDDRAGPHICYRVHPTNTIKETLEAVQLEVSAVIASALNTQTLGFQNDQPNSSKRRILEDVLQRKGFLSTIASLAPYRQAFDQRDKLYDAISGNRVAGSDLRSDVDAKLPCADGTPGPRQQFTAVIELSSFNRGGLEKVVLDSALDFRRCGVEPIIVSCGQVGHLGEIARGAGVETVQLPAERADEFYEKLLKSRKVDIAISHFSYQGYKIFKKLGIPNVTFIHNIYAMLREKALSDFLEADPFVDRYISVSSLATEFAVSKYGIDRSKISTIPNGLILEEHRKRRDQPAYDRRSLGVKDSDFLFLNVASYNLHKSHYLMAEAMRLILAKRRDIKILCVGNVIHPPHIDQLRADLIEWGLTQHMLLPGYFDDVAPLHKAADAFLLPSLIEGWSIAMNEAMFYGKPMILTETGGAPEVIVDSDIGLLVPNEYGSVTNLDCSMLDQIAYDQRKFQTAPYLANAMCKFADNRNYWKEKGTHGHRKVLEQLNFADVTEKYVEVCRDLLA